MVTIFKGVQSSCMEWGRKSFTRTTTAREKRNGIRSQQGRFRSGSSKTSGKGVGVLRNRWDKVVLRNCSLQSVHSPLLKVFYGWKVLCRQSAVGEAVWGEVHHCCPIFHIFVSEEEHYLHSSSLAECAAHLIRLNSYQSFSLAVHWNNSDSLW